MSRQIEVQIKVDDSNIHFDQLERVFEEVMPPFIQVGLFKIVGDAQQHSPVYRGLFRAEIQNALDKISPATFQGVVFFSLNYGLVIEGIDEEGNDTEFGRRPGTFPNLSELRLWVERVISPPEEKIDEVTFLVGRKIQAQGIRPKRPIGNAFNRNKDFVNREIDRGVEEVFKQL
jgi:hypothetical protein